MSIPLPDVIPQPPRWPLLGNLLCIDRTAPAQSLAHLIRQYGPIVRLELPGRTVLLLGNHELVNEVCDETRFDKFLSAGLRQVRLFAGDGLFTAETQEANWRKAHSILLPNFGGAAMRGYLPQMIDIAEQLILKWERLNSDEVIDVPEDMTRLTLDTIGLCGFDYRFNSFYREQPHPFVESMFGAMNEALLRMNRLGIQNALMFWRRRQLKKDIRQLNEVVDWLIAQRRADAEALATKTDLLNYMLTGADKQSGQRLDDVNIRYQIITFLIAGHETTSGLLSFALYFLLKHPAALAKAVAEVDAVLGRDASVRPTLAQVQRLGYVLQVLKESLRLWPTAPNITLTAKQETTLAGRYPVKPGEPLTFVLLALHRDPDVWGADAEAFRPERFAPDLEAKLPPNAFKPFGNGQRACIGQQFALQEAVLVLGMILRRFDLIDFSNYQLRVKESLTIKPAGFQIRVSVRKSVATPAAPAPVEVRTPVPSEALATPTGGGTPLLVLYGSNLGTAESLAQRVAEDGRARGFAVRIGTLDEGINLPRAGVVLVICSSYNGLPPDNAVCFCGSLPGDEPLTGVRYSVFGCGDRNWLSTYQAVPKQIDERLFVRGASRIHPRGEGDAADDFEGQFLTWYRPLWGRIAVEFGLEMPAAAPVKPAGYRIEVVPVEIDPLRATASHDAVPMRIVANRELQRGGERSTRHVEVELPSSLPYQAGDHLGILPRNRTKLLGRVLARFQLDGGTQIVLRRDGSAKSHLPLDRPVRLEELLAVCVELQETATREQVETLAERTACPPEKARLLALATNYREDVFSRSRSVLDLLEEFAACELTFADYLGMLPALRPRYYSISSSPQVDARVASVTVGVVRAPARSGRGLHEGVASCYLAELGVGAEVLAFVRDPGTGFRPPDDPLTPMIMVGAGTGLAPFRGFLQERAQQKQQGDVGPSLLVFGCRTPEQDFLYADELHEFEARGIVRLVPAFSRVPGQPRVYVQQAVTLQGEAVWQLLEQGAIVYVCGDAAKMAPAVRAAFASVYQAKTGGDPEAWLADLVATGRYVEDVWASS